MNIFTDKIYVDYVPGYPFGNITKYNKEINTE